MLSYRGQKNTEEFLMASRSMSTLPMTLSLIASFMSAITLLGTPAEMYVSGKKKIFYLVNFTTSRIFCYVFFHVLTPIFSQCGGPYPCEVVYLILLITP